MMTEIQVIPANHLGLNEMGEDMSKPEIAVLIVEDDEDDYLIVRDYLREVTRTKYKLDWAPTYDEALKTIRRCAHDVYLVDYRLSGKSGLDLLREIRKLEMKAPVILLTGMENEKVDLAAMENGAADYLVKQQMTGPLLERTLRYALRDAEMKAALEELAMHDGLTGLFNRREMERFLNEEVHRHRRHGSPVGFLLADIDYFKKVNDTHGHQIGDDVLRWVAKHLMDTVRPIDRTARYGGEEIAVIAPQSSAQSSKEMAERLRLVLADAPFVTTAESGESIEIPITASFGVASLPEDADSAESLIAAADRALYEAKRAGRNRVVRYGKTD